MDNVINLPDNTQRHFLECGDCGGARMAICTEYVLCLNRECQNKIPLTAVPDLFEPEQPDAS